MQDIWLMDSECCDTCGAILDYFEDVICTDCLRDAWYNAEQEKYDVADYDEVGTLAYDTEEWERGLPPMPAPGKNKTP